MRLAAILLLASITTITASAADESPFKTMKEKASYALGMNMGKTLRQRNADIDPELYLKAMKEAMAGGKLLMTDEQVRETLTAYQGELQSRSLEKNKKEGATFLTENKTKPGVLTTASGLQYKIDTKGAGKTPTTNDSVVCHYRGTLINGDEFDSSYKRGEPATFPVTGVIKGWTEALQMMPIGSKWKLFIPAELAYGERGGARVPPNATLLFDIELVGIKDPSETRAASPTVTPKVKTLDSKQLSIQPSSSAAPKVTK